MLEIKHRIKPEEKKYIEYLKTKNDNCSYVEIDPENNYYWYWCSILKKNCSLGSMQHLSHLCKYRFKKKKGIKIKRIEKALKFFTIFDIIYRKKNYYVNLIHYKIKCKKCGKLYSEHIYCGYKQIYTNDWICPIDIKDKIKN